MLDLTIAIPTLNEEKNLPTCLKAIGDDLAKKIYLIDSGSIDKTTTIANENGVEIINFEWNGKFPKKRNWFLRNVVLDTKWVLFLDADEFITKEFKEELRSILPNSDKVGYWLNYSIYFMGKKLRGGYPLDKLALFRVGAGEYERIDEDSWSKMDMEVHEHPVLEGEIGKIKAQIEHNDYKGLSAYLAKHLEYAKWEAKRYISLSVKQKKHFTLKQKVKYAIMASPFSGIIYFNITYFILGGFRDGLKGLHFSLLKMNYFNTISALIQEYKQTSL